MKVESSFKKDDDLTKTYLLFFHQLHRVKSITFEQIKSCRQHKRTYAFAIIRLTYNQFALYIINCYFLTFRNSGDFQIAMYRIWKNLHLSSGGMI